MQRIIETARKAAASEAIVLLRGESGTGKSVFARAIHHWSPRAAKPMAVVACPAVPGRSSRKRALRPCQRRVYGGGAGRSGAHRGLRGRHALPGRNRRHGPFGPGQAAALYPGQGIRASRGSDDPQGRCAHRRGHQRRPREAGGRGPFPGRPLLPDSMSSA